MYSLILFCLLFSFPIFSNESFTSFYIGIILLLFVFLKDLKSNLVSLKKIQSDKQIFKIFIFLIFIIIITFLIPIFQGTNDFSMIKTLVNQLIRLITLSFFMASIANKSRMNKIQILVNVFIIQSVIQFTSFISPSIRDFFNQFRTEYSIQKGQIEYGNIRGLSISDTSFFGLGVAYGLIFIIYIYFWSDIKPKNIVLKGFILMLLLFGGVSAARTSMIGLMIAFFIKILSVILGNRMRINKSWTIKELIILNVSLFCSIIISTIVFYYLKLKNINLKFLKTFENFAFQFWNNYKSKGTFRTRSTDVLFGQMYFLPTTKTLLIGDGRYTNLDGTYYMNTDSGFMRNILYYGVFGIVLYFIYQLLFFSWNKKNNFLLNIGMLLFLVICQIKGETLGFLIITQQIAYYILISNKDYKIG